MGIWQYGQLYFVKYIYVVIVVASDFICGIYVDIFSSYLYVG